MALGQQKRPRLDPCWAMVIGPGSKHPPWRHPSLPASLAMVGAVGLKAKLPEFAIHHHARHGLSEVDRFLRRLAEETLLLLGIPGCQAGGTHHLHCFTCLSFLHLAIANAPFVRGLQELLGQELAMSTPAPSPHQHGCHGRYRRAGSPLEQKVHQVGRRRARDMWEIRQWCKKNCDPPTCSAPRCQGEMIWQWCKKNCSLHFSGPM